MSDSGQDELAAVVCTVMNLQFLQKASYGPSDYEILGTSCHSAMRANGIPILPVFFVSPRNVNIW